MIPLPLRKVDDGEAKEVQDYYESFVTAHKGDVRAALHDPKFDSFKFRTYMRKLYQEEKGVFHEILHVIRLGDWGFVTVGPELYLEYGHKLRARIKAEHLFLAELTDQAGYYVPTKAAEGTGGYSTNLGSQIISAEGGELLIECAIQKMNQLLEV